MPTELIPESSTDASRPVTSTTERPRRLRVWHALRSRQADAVAAVGYVFLSAIFSVRLWADLDNRSPAGGSGDHSLFEWMLAHGARVVTRGEFPLFTDRLNTPDGVNLMANTSALGLTLPMAAVTLLLGTQVSYAVLLVVGLAGTAYGWFWVFSRRLDVPAWAAALGGAFCGFAPGMVAHSEGHLNWTAQMLVPFLVDRLFRLREPGHTARTCLVLAVLMIYQAFIAEEVLFYVGLAVAAFAVAYATARWREVRTQVTRVIARLAITCGVAAVVLAYPLWYQFFGPQSYHGTPVGGTRMSTDLAALTSFGSKSLAGNAAASLAPNAAEENSFLGWPLLAMAVVLAMWLWRDAIARAASITALIFGALSLGPQVVVAGHPTGVPGPWAALRYVPLFDAVVPTRLSLVMIPCLAAMLLVAIGRLRTAAETAPNSARPALAWVGAAALAAALVPLVPLPMRTVDRDPVPDFITHRLWEPYVGNGGSMMVITSRPLNTTGMRWAARTGLDFSISAGYFLGPGGPDGRAMYGAPLRPTSRLIADVSRLHRVPPITATDRDAARDDLRYWNVSLIVLPDPTDVTHGGLVSDLVGGNGIVTGGVRVWDVRRLAQ